MHTTRFEKCQPILFS